MKDRANWLVVAQFVLLAVLIVLPFVVPVAPLWTGQQATVLAVLLVGVGLLLAGAGAVALGRDLVVQVTPREGAALRTAGPFRLTRSEGTRSSPILRWARRRRCYGTPGTCWRTLAWGSTERSLWEPLAPVTLIPPRVRTLTEGRAGL